MLDKNDPRLVKTKRLLNRGLLNLALEFSEGVQDDDPTSGQELLLHVFAAMRDHLSFLDASERLSPEDLPRELLDFFINSHVFVGNTEKLRQIVNELVQNRKSPSEILSMASVLLEIGDVEGSLELLDQVPTSSRTETAFQFFEARVLSSQKNYEASVVKLENLKKLVNSSPRTTQRTHFIKQIAFSLARSYDKLNEFQSAWRSAQEGHEEDDLNFDIGTYEAVCEDIMKFFTKKRLQTLNRATEVPVEPLLVMGNPRSGTTLLDTILGMHDQVASGGELSIGSRIQNQLPKLLDSYSGFPDCLVDLRISDANKLARDYANTVNRISLGRKYVTNKALNINSQLGLFFCITPGMKVISLHRHPLDNCISCYLSLVGVPGHTYNKRQDHQARVWIMRRRLQDHWAEVAEDIPILQLHYESMVHNQEHETRRILRFFDLDFQSGCLQFHEAPGTAATVSKEQVREPMYQTSAGRWKNYEPHIPLLVDELGPWCGE